ncbi:MAG: ExeA family protein [Porticoccaceae bacterium]
MSIYLQHFALKREPFSIVPDPGFLYPSIYHRQAVAHLKYGLDREGGFILLTGEVGTGKTTLTRTMIKRIPPHVRVAYILNSKLNTTDVLASICDELNIELPADAELSFTKKCIDALNQDLLAAHAEGKKTLIVIEEAQNLTPEVLETLRLLSNLETSTQKLLHILLVGQPELLEILAQKELRQLNQRVVSRFHLSPLDKDDLSNYINHRLHRAGAKKAIFEPACISALFRLTGGVPRLINLVCHQALVAAYANGEKMVSAKLVNQAAAEILSENRAGTKSKTGLIAAAVLILSLAALAVVYNATGLFSSLEASPVAPPPAIIEVEKPALEAPVIADSPAAEVVEDQPAAIANPFTGLLLAWGIDAAEVFSEEELSSVADLQQLRMEKISAVSLGYIEKVNRPGIVWLLGENGYLKTYILTRLDAGTVTLEDRQGATSIDREGFAENWNGVYLYLWKPPLGYSAPLTVTGNTGNGLQVNPQVVDWLQLQLQAIDQGSERVISGGRYTAAVAQQVLLFQQQQGLAADGILGRETLMRLNQFAEEAIPQLVESQ